MRSSRVTLARERRLCWLVAGIVFALDQATKWWVVTSMTLWTERIPVIPGFFDLVHYLNKGAAFGFLNDAEGWGTVLFTCIALAAMGLLGWGIWREQGLLPGGGMRMRLGLALLLGGTAGNLLDRLRLGAVVDFLDVYVNDWHWPAFNVADSAITVGCLGLIWLVATTPVSPETTGRSAADASRKDDA